MVASPKTSNREQQILQYYPLVEQIAYRLKRRVPAHIDFEELRSVGLIGLIEALDRYDHSKGVPFRAYAEIRVNGAMLDYLRKEDWVPRSIRKQMKLLEQGHKILQEKEMAVTDKNLGLVLGLNKEEVRKLLFETQSRVLLSSSINITKAEELFLEEVLEDTDQNILLDFISHEKEERVRDALDMLESREKQVLEMYYFDEQNLRSIGKKFKITESRACQIRKSAIKTLQKKLSVDLL
jgi:RNA polymerase sigma factor for flagellar operon FliA